MFNVSVPAWFDALNFFPSITMLFVYVYMSSIAGNFSAPLTLYDANSYMPDLIDFLPHAESDKAQTSTMEHTNANDNIFLMFMTIYYNIAAPVSIIIKQIAIQRLFNI